MPGIIDFINKNHKYINNVLGDISRFNTAESFQEWNNAYENIKANAPGGKSVKKSDSYNYTINPDDAPGTTDLSGFDKKLDVLKTNPNIYNEADFYIKNPDWQKLREDFVSQGTGQKPKTYDEYLKEKNPDLYNKYQEAITSQKEARSKLTPEQLQSIATQHQETDDEGNPIEKQENQFQYSNRDIQNYNKKLYDFEQNFKSKFQNHSLYSQELSKPFLENISGDYKAYNKTSLPQMQYFGIDGMLVGLNKNTKEVTTLKDFRQTGELPNNIQNMKSLDIIKSTDKEGKDAFYRVTYVKKADGTYDTAIVGDANEAEYNSQTNFEENIRTAYKSGNYPNYRRSGNYNSGYGQNDGIKSPNDQNQIIEAENEIKRLEALLKNPQHFSGQEDSKSAPERINEIMTEIYKQKRVLQNAYDNAQKRRKLYNGEY